MTDQIGAKIRARRKTLGLTLSQLADRSGVSAAMLSEVERDVKNPTVRLAYQVARALECSLTELLSEPPPTPIEVTRRQDVVPYVDPDSGLRRWGKMSSLLRGSLETAWYHLPPGAESGEMAPNVPGLTEQIMVIRGKLEAVLGGEVVHLGAGDSVTYTVRTTNYRNASEQEPLEFLLISDRSRAR